MRKPYHIIPNFETQNYTDSFYIQYNMRINHEKTIRL